MTSCRHKFFTLKDFLSKFLTIFYLWSCCKNICKFYKSIMLRSLINKNNSIWRKDIFNLDF